MEKFDKLLKNKSQSLKMKYELRFYDIKKYLDEMDKIEKNEKHMIDLPMGLKSFDDVIKFRCYDNEILNVMIKNITITINNIKRKLEFINDYQKYLIEDYEIKDCLNWEIMLVDELARTEEEKKFLIELKN